MINSVTIMQSPVNNGIWLAKCYKAGELVHTEECLTAEAAQEYAAKWLQEQDIVRLVA